MHTDSIKNYWLLLTNRTSARNLTFASQTIEKIIKRYSAPGRHYHDMAHLSDLICLQQQYAPFIVDNDSLLYAIYFHDIIYSVTRSDNEERSAHEAVTFLNRIGYPEDKQQKVFAFIAATQKHINPLGDPDLDYLLDFDLHILGSTPPQYEAYTKQIRKEYYLYPSFMYNRGRKKVLQHFLSQPAIYKTAVFREKYEKKARENMERELDQL
ncbi:hypothetical protein GFS24_17875 [Chitinophaga sp. SYP-B3965]|uniref:HD domain-containing protein n=1 Tax=Chitinophaga sp. SYP-B3965 TaxID=2663120 RepID=UPI001299DD57|nr:hypothetical protein [Chitinophaga sp. SYP-B3965]MRG46996.1 hypothetical protein [Chitinophaga sp. SYP-B3965]